MAELIGTHLGSEERRILASDWSTTVISFLSDESAHLDST